MGVAGRAGPHAAQGAANAEAGGALMGAAAGAAAASATVSRSATPSMFSSAVGSQATQNQALSSGRVEVKPPPFVCRGRQFVLHEPFVDEARRQQIRSIIRNRMIGETLAKVRRNDEHHARASRAKMVMSTKALLERQGLELSARLRNLEQQKDTLKLLLEQIEQEDSAESASEMDTKA